MDITFYAILTVSKTINFRRFQAERVCRRQCQIWCKWKGVLQMDRKHYGKRRNCSSRVISPVSTLFFFFQNTCIANKTKPGLVWERVKDDCLIPTLGTSIFFFFPAMFSKSSPQGIVENEIIFGKGYTVVVGVRLIRLSLHQTTRPN